jgi:diguanylate cyclase (GGDEF)-like protein
LNTPTTHAAHDAAELGAHAPEAVAELGARARRFFVRDRRLQLEVVGTFVLILALVAGAVTLAYRALNREARDNQALTNALQLMREVDDIRFMGSDVSGLQTAYAFQIRRGQPDADSDSSLLRRAFLDARERFVQRLAQLPPQRLTQEERRHLSAARGVMSEFVALDKKIISGYRAAAPADISQANERITYAQTILFTQVAYSLTQLSGLVTARADATIQLATDTTATTRLWIRRIVIASVILSGSLAAAVFQLQRRRGQLLQRLEEYARIDALTGAVNRRGWEDALPAALHRASRTGETLAVVLLDLDRFKLFNDERGHQAGDALLREMGALLRYSVRRDDVVARYGGEEFALVLHGCESAEQARVWFARVQERMPHGQTCSAGLLLCDGSERGEQVVATVDAALYRAKQAGRNCVEIVDPLPGERTRKRGLRSVA